MCKKSRGVNHDTGCLGVDPNANANHAWNTGGSSNDACTQLYHGNKPTSESETYAVQRALNHSSSILYFSLHGSGNFWLTSFGNIDTKTKECFVAEDEPEMLRVANAEADAIEKVENTMRKRGPTCSTAGSIMDFAKVVSGIKYGAVVSSTSVVPPSEIEPSYREIWAGLVAS